MILRNTLTKEKLDIPYSEFRKKFAKEIQEASVKEVVDELMVDFK